LPNTSITVTLPDGTKTTSSHTTQLDLHQTLPPTVNTAHIMPKLRNSLFSIGQLCDAGCTDTANIQYQGNTIINGIRSPLTNLWHIQLPITKAQPTATHVANSLYHYSASAADRIAFYHACCFSPALSTWCKAIDQGHFVTWPNLTSKLVRLYPPTSTAMHKGHLDQGRKNQRSTKKQKSTPATPEPTTDSEPPIIPPFDPTTRSQAIFATCEPMADQIASDLTGRFLAPSNSGNNYILIVYDYDSNYIAAEPMKTRSAQEHLDAYKRIFTLLSSRGLKPQLQRLDNEASTQLKTYLQDNTVEFQLAPPQVH
jgi:hypothetical protein